MNLASSLSPALWDLLAHSRLRGGAALELFDEELRPVFEPADDPRITAVRGARDLEFCGRADVSFRHVLRGGEDAQLRMPPWHLALLPVRVERQPVGLLVAIARDEPDATDDTTAETLSDARAWRTMIEADLRAGQHLMMEDQRVRRAAAVACFSADLQECETEHQLLSGVLQALSVWYDVDARIYCRDLTGAFVLRATLPGVDSSGVPRVLEPTSVPQSRGAHAPRPRVEQLGSHGRQDEWCFLVRCGAAEQWLVTAAGSVEPAVARQVESLLRAFSTALERVRESEARALCVLVQDTCCGRSPLADPVRLATALLALICRYVEADEGEWTVADTRRRRERTEIDPTCVRVAMSIGKDRLAEIAILRHGSDPFRPHQAATILAALPLLRAWLSGGAGDADWSAYFAAGESPKVALSREAVSST